jgi:gluconate 5-dehydrogenase
MVLESFSLKGKVALVTGGSRGLGFAMAQALGEAGARVVISARDARQLAAAASRLQAIDIEATWRAFDVGDETACRVSIDEVIAKQGHLDILVNNAGVNVRGPIVDYSYEDFERVLGIHLLGAFALSREAARHMVARGWGRIINIVSAMVRTPRPQVPAYAAAKGGLDALTRQMGVELIAKGVTVNAIAPGYFETELNAPLLANAEFVAMVNKRTPAGRWAKPAELGGAAVFLASDAAGFVTGQTLYVDGGLTVSL